LHLVLTVRNEELDHHPGQVSLPGGGWEKGDASFQETALREACEEIGVDTAVPEILGPLTPLYIPPSNNVIYPFVGYVSQRPEFHPDPKEVAKLVDVPLGLLLRPATRYEEDWNVDDIVRRVAFYAVGEHKVWGATAIVLAEFLALVRAVLESRSVPGKVELVERASGAKSKE
jgi:8-oxo-dGTP pyrophosphatase MutT (NUDIX family)